MVRSREPPSVLECAPSVFYSFFLSIQRLLAHCQLCFARLLIQPWSICLILTKAAAFSREKHKQIKIMDGTD